MPLDSPSTISIPPWTTPVTRSYSTTRTSTDQNSTTAPHRGYSTTTVFAIISFPKSVINKIPVRGGSINASQTAPSVVELTSTITLPRMVYVLPPFGSAPTPRSTTTTLTPPPYPWTETTKDTRINRGTSTTTWSSDSPTSSISKGSKGSGHGRAPFCHKPCMFCPPEFSNTSGGGGSSGGTGSGSGSEGDNDDECSTETAQVCSTVCFAGSGCDFNCSTTTGCSATASSTRVVGTLAPGVAITMNQLSTTQTDDPDKDLNSTISLESVLSSKFGTLTVIEGLGPTTTTATGPAPTNGNAAGTIVLYYYYSLVPHRLLEGIIHVDKCIHKLGHRW